jgi:PAS domain S-box-containing protein
VSVSEPLVQASLLGEAIDPGPVAVMVADEDGRYMAVNRFACDLLGYTREELLGLGMHDVAGAGGGNGALAALVATSRWEGDSELTRKDGTVLRVSWMARETRVAGMTLYVSVGRPVGPPSLSAA